MKKIVVVLPTFNEKDNLESFANKVLEQSKNLPGYTIEVLIALDKRTNDGTSEIANKLVKSNNKIHLLNVDPGLGVALIKGHQYAIANFHPDILAQMDADGQVEIDVLPRLVKALEDGYNLAIGSRFIKGGKNRLSLSRKIFSYGSSMISRTIMGPFSIREFANSARAFTPELFEKINLDRLPWREKTFIVQPAFLNEAILAGAKYKEIPLVFKNRAQGYSKNKIVNYTYDVISYAIDARLHKWGINVPFFEMSHKAKTLIKFGLVGVVGTAVDFVFYNYFIGHFGIPPATSKAFSTEIAIITNFTFNNFWTFRYRKTKSNIWQKLITFNFVSFGGLAIGVGIIKLLHLIYGDGYANILGLSLAYYNLYFFITIPPVMTWNFTINHLVTWKNKVD